MRDDNRKRPQSLRKAQFIKRLFPDHWKGMLARLEAEGDRRGGILPFPTEPDDKEPETPSEPSA